MSQKGENVSLEKFSNIRQIFKQEEEWKHLLVEEVNCLQQSIAQKEEKISEQRVQLDELKMSFFHNYDLLKSCDAEIANYNQALYELQTVLARREAEISELQVTLDQTKDDLVRSQHDAVDWQSRFEDVSRRAMTQEAELRRTSNLALIKLAESEAVERRRLTAELTRAQMDLEAERARSGADLEAALAEASRRASDLSVEMGRAQVVAEMRASTAEDVASRARQESKRLNQELLSANETIARLDSDVAAKEQALYNAEKQLVELKEELKKVEKAKAVCDFRILQLELRHATTKDTMTKEIELLKESEKLLKMEVCKLNRNLVSAQEVAEAEHRRLNATADKARSKIEETLETAESERQSVLNNCKDLETENRRLRGDFSRVLDHANSLNEKTSSVPRKNRNARDLVAQIISLQLSCDKLLDENRQLHRNDSGNAGVNEVKGQLHDAYQQAEHLTKENTKLLQLSNKMRAQQMREKDPIIVPTAFPRRKVESYGEKWARQNLENLSPEPPVEKKSSPRGGDELSFNLPSNNNKKYFQA